MKKHKYELGHEPKETGTERDVKGMPHKDGRHPHMRYSHHEMGEYREGSHHHDHHRSKKD